MSPGSTGEGPVVLFMIPHDLKFNSFDMGLDGRVVEYSIASVPVLS
jgi:hypothetical protein